MSRLSISSAPKTPGEEGPSKTRNTLYDIEYLLDHDGADSGDLREAKHFACGCCRGLLVDPVQANCGKQGHFCCRQCLFGGEDPAVVASNSFSSAGSMGAGPGGAGLLSPQRAGGKPPLTDHCPWCLEVGGAQIILLLVLCSRVFIYTPVTIGTVSFSVVVFRPLLVVWSMLVSW